MHPPGTPRDLAGLSCWACGHALDGVTEAGNAFCDRHPCDDCHSCGPATSTTTVAGTPYCGGENAATGHSCKLVAIYSEMT